MALTKLRVSSHHLAIETGWYHKPSALPIEQRLCSSCAQVQDELHLLCHCLLNANLRDALFRDVSKFNPDFIQLSPQEKLVFLMNMTPPLLINNLAVFVYQSLLLI